jgi:hypothetical protein
MSTTVGAVGGQDDVQFIASGRDQLPLTGLVNTNHEA